MKSDDLDRLIRELSGPLRLFAAQIADSPDDVVQEAFVELAALTVMPDRPSAWLYQVVRNRAVSWQRSIVRRRKREAIAMANRPEWFESSAEQQLDADRCAAALKELAPGDRAIVVAKIWSDLTFEEIGRACGVTASTACRRYTRALNKMRKMLEPTQSLPVDR